MDSEIIPASDIIKTAGGLANKWPAIFFALSANVVLGLALWLMFGYLESLSGCPGAA